MATITMLDRADEFRIEIVGRFSGAPVEEVAAAWHTILSEPIPRRVTVDITRLDGYDAGGRKLLSDMYHHGTKFAAASPDSLVYLNDISATRRTGLKLVMTPAASEQPARAPGSGKSKPKRAAMRAAANQ